jgi:hypothetical protein
MQFQFLGECIASLSYYSVSYERYFFVGLKLRTLCLWGKHTTIIPEGMPLLHFTAATVYGTIRPTQRCIEFATDPLRMTENEDPR